MKVKKDKLDYKMRPDYNQNFAPDWSETMTKEEAERELSGSREHAFVFKGPGWYLTSKDTLLVTPVDTNPSLFTFHVYNDRNPCDSFNWIANAPTRTDSR